MRRRLVLLFGTLMGCVLAALCVPLAIGVIESCQQTALAAQVGDVTRFAMAAQQAGGDADLATLRTDLTRYRDVYGISILIVDRDGSLVAGPPDTSVLRDPRVTAHIGTAFDGHRSATSSPIWPWQDVPLVAAVPVMRGGEVTGAAVGIASTETLRTLGWQNLAALAAAAALALVACVYCASRLASWVLRPIARLDDAAREFSFGAPRLRLGDLSGPAELQRLAGTFDAMWDAVEQVLANQRAFVADASHQLRGPLAALALRLDGLRLRLGDAQVEEFDAVQEEATRLTYVLDMLLDLAAAEHMAALMESTDVMALTQRRIEAWAALAAARGITLRGPDGGAVKCLTDPALCDTALDAVLENAIKFTPPGGDVGVDVVVDGANVLIRVTDDGPGLRPEEFDQIANRFWRSPVMQNVSGSGLGLSIAAALLGSMGGAIRFAPVVPTGLAVTIEMPYRRDGAGGDGDLEAGAGGESAPGSPTRRELPCGPAVSRIGVAP